jgi:hypothetical protein
LLLNTLYAVRLHLRCEDTAKVLQKVLHVVVLSNEPVREAFNDAAIAEAITGFKRVGLERLFLLSDCFIFRLCYLVIHAAI